MSESYFPLTAEHFIMKMSCFKVSPTGSVSLLLQCYLWCTMVFTLSTDLGPADSSPYEDPLGGAMTSLHLAKAHPVRN